MTISELIKELRRIKKEHGDLPVTLEGDTWEEFRGITLWTIASIATGKAERVTIEPVVDIDIEI